MKPLVQESVTMATKCSSSATMVTEYNNVSMRSHRSHRNPYASHRKSAVELLEASKGEYVKSSKVLNHKQKLKHPENLSVGNREVISVPLPFEDVVTPSQDTLTEKTGCLATNENTRSNKSPINEDNPKDLFVTNSELTVDTSVNSIINDTTSCIVTNSTNENNSLLSSIETSASSSKSNSVLTTASSISPKTITSSSSSSSSPTSAASRNSSGPTSTSSPPTVSRKSSVPTTSSPPSASRKSSVPTTSSPRSSSRKSSVPTTSSPPSVSRKSSVPTSIALTSSTNSKSKSDDDHINFKKPLPTPQSPGVKPVVPPKPGSKPVVAPKLGPKPVINTKSDKPVPPPRPVRKSSASTKSDSSEKNCSDNTMSSSDKSSSKAFNAHDHKRFSSVSASACDTSSKGSDSVEGSKSLREARYSLSSQSDVFLKPISSNNLSTSVGVLVERKRSPIPKPRIDKQLNEIELPPRRPLHRSQSDLSNCRHSRTSSDFSDLSSRLSRTSTEVERFFNEMGIDHSVLEPMRRLSETKRRENVDSVSSLDSLDGRSLSSRLSNDLDRLPMESEQDLSERDPGTTSVVERNARIIKWLCNVKKARTVQTKHANRKS